MLTSELILLPPGCVVTTRGLTLRPGLTREEWLNLGGGISELAAATPWVLGDFLAYGDQFFADKKGVKRIPDGLYEQIALQIGCAEQTLRNAKCVCAALPLSRRRDKLTLAHAAEIVGRAPVGQHEFWIDKATKEELSVKALREQLRKSRAIYQPEPNDLGTHSFLETARQFVRDYQAESSDFDEKYRTELKKILAPVIKDLG